MTDINLAAQIASIKREIALRERVYPRQIEAGRMNQAAADRELAAMRAALATLEANNREQERRRALEAALRTVLDRIAGTDIGRFPMPATASATLAEFVSRALIADAASADPSEAMNG